VDFGSLHPIATWGMCIEGRRQHAMCTIIGIAAMPFTSRRGMLAIGIRCTHGAACVAAMRQGAAPSGILATPVQGNIHHKPGHFVTHVGNRELRKHPIAGLH
jgi:hypothetical protein